MLFLRACCSGHCYKDCVRYTQLYTQLTYMQLDGVRDRATRCIATDSCDGLVQVFEEKSQTQH